MSIQITCPGCHKRFSVSEKFAGKQGPCPQCKEVITIPKPEDAVVIHAPVHEAGSVDSKGKSVLKPVAKKDAKFNPVFAGIVGAVSLAIVATAFVIGRGESGPDWWMLIAGAVLLGPLLSWAAYGFMRDDELEPYRGTSLIIRVTICGLVYALAWGVFMFVGERVFGDATFDSPLLLETWQLLALSAFAAGIGTFAAYITLDLEPTSGFFHFAMYFGVTIVLRLLMSLPALPGLVG